MNCSIVTLSNPESYYGADNGGVIDAGVAQLCKDACASAVLPGRFSQYDSDGDGKVWITWQYFMPDMIRRKRNDRCNLGTSGECR